MNTPDSLDTIPRALVHFPYVLRSLVGNQSSVLTIGHTVRAMIETLERDYPGIRFRLCYETGELRPYVNIFLNREDIRYLQGLDTPLPHNAIIHILPSVAGGSSLRLLTKVEQKY